MNDYSSDELNVMLDVLKFFENVLGSLPTTPNKGYYTDAISKIRGILEYQNVKAVNIINNLKFCPNCGMIIDTESVSDMHYCPNCGQRIDITKTIIDKLFAIKNTNTGEIIFNARGGAYHTFDAAYKKYEQLGQDNHKIVTYKLSNNV